jgi:hypothetical protein
VLSGAQAGAALRRLREQHRKAEPVPFAADVATATRVDQVLIEELTVRETAGSPSRYEYELVLRQFTPPPAPAAPVEDAVAGDARAASDEQVTKSASGQGTLAVEVKNPSGDFSALAVLVEGTSDAGGRVSMTLFDQREGVYRREDMPAGTYAVTLVRRAVP